MYPELCPNLLPVYDIFGKLALHQLGRYQNLLRFIMFVKKLVESTNARVIVGPVVPEFV